MGSATITGSRGGAFDEPPWTVDHGRAVIALDRALFYIRHPYGRRLATPRGDGAAPSLYDRMVGAIQPVLAGVRRRLPPGARAAEKAVGCPRADGTARFDPGGEIVGLATLAMGPEVTFLQAVHFREGVIHIEVLNLRPAVSVLLLFATLPECSQNQTAVSDTLRLLSDF